MSATTLPRPITTRWSAVSCSSLIRWLDTSTARPSRGQRPQEAAHPHDALGVQAVERLVEHEHRRVAEQRRGDAEPLPHAERVAAGLAPGHRLQAGLLDHLVDPPGGQALRVGQPQQVVAAGPARVQRGGVQQRRRRGSAGAAGCGTAARRSARCPRRRASRPRITRIVVDFPAPLGPTKPVTCPGATVNDIPSSASGRPEPLAQAGDFDGRFHAGNARSASGAVVTPGAIFAVAVRGTRVSASLARGTAPSLAAATLSVPTAWQSGRGSTGNGRATVVAPATRRPSPGRCWACSRWPSRSRGPRHRRDRAVRPGCCPARPGHHAAAGAPASDRRRRGRHRGERALARTLPHPDRRGPRRPAHRPVPARPAGSRGAALTRVALPTVPGARPRRPSLRFRGADPHRAAGLAGPGGRRGRHRPPGARRGAGEQAPPGRSSPAPCSSTRRAANGPASPASCTMSSPTTSRWSPCRRRPPG